MRRTSLEIIESRIAEEEARTEKRNKQIREVHASGVSVALIARWTKCSTYTVRKILAHEELLPIPESYKQP